MNTTLFCRLAGRRLAALLPAVASLLAATALSAAPKITPPKDIIGFSIGDDYHVANYTQMSTMLKKWETESDRLKVVSIGQTEEGRQQYMAILSSPENLKNLEHYRTLSQRMAHAEMSPEEAHKLAKEGKTVVWIDGGLHATETVNSQTLIEMVYQMVSLDDEETHRLLNDTIAIMPCPNPDGVELAANWYMRNEDEKQRTLNALPRLYEKYAGHDNNRDAIIMNLKETINQNRVLYVDWNPQLMLNVHQAGPAGTVVFIPPFRDPYNYNYDPLITLGIESVGTALHTRLVARGMGGSVSRSNAPYSTWANGGIRYATYFRNEIGLLTEIIGNPTPMELPLIPDHQLPNGEGALPVKPQIWHYRQSIDYQIQIERAILDYGSRNREDVLFNIYTMGRNSIQRGSQDTWTITPKRITALKEAAAKMEAENPAAGRGGRGGRGGGGGGGDNPFGRGPAPAPAELYEKVLHDPAHRDPRGFIISADQDDFATAVKFVNVLLKGGIDVLKATAPFEVAGKKYPAGSFVVKTAQAFRPAVMDSFEPMDHPTDLEYPGGPPKRPYDITGWTLAVQMGIAFDRVYDGFDGPFEKVGFDLLPPPVAQVSGPAKPAGWLVSHKQNDSFILINRLLKAKADVYWLDHEETAGGKTLGTGTIWIPASAVAEPIVAKAAKEIGIPAYAVATKPSGAATKLKPIRIGLVDIYGGSMPSGWLRFLFERYEFPFELVFPQVLDAGNLKSSYDVLVFPSDTYTEGRGGRGGLGGGFGRFGVAAESIPEEFRSMLGSVSRAKSVPPIKQFVEEGGTVLAIGAAASIGEAIGLPVKDHLVEKGPDGQPVHLSNDKFYVPGSVLRAKFNNKDPLAFGMPEDGFVFFDDSPVFDRDQSSSTTANRVAWFGDSDLLYSGWAIGQKYLAGGELATEAKVGAGHLVLIGFEATFRATPHGTFKLLFNGVYYGSGTQVPSL